MTKQGHVISMPVLMGITLLGVVVGSLSTNFKCPPIPSQEQTRLDIHYHDQEQQLDKSTAQLKNTSEYQSFDPTDLITPIAAAILATLAIAGIRRLSDKPSTKHHDSSQHPSKILSW